MGRAGVGLSPVSKLLIDGGNVAGALEIETPHRLIQVNEVKMFHTKAVAHWRALMASAQEKMGGVSSGIGFIGSPGWVLSGAVVLGAIEGALSSANAKAGMKIVSQAAEFMNEMRNRAVYVRISEIENVDIPNPDAWQARQGGISFSMLGEDFVAVRAMDGAELMVRWSAVNSYRLT